jgi:hypothetical protein
MKRATGREERERETKERWSARPALCTFRSEAGGGDEYSAIAEWRVTHPETPQGLWERHCRGWNGDAESSW